MSITKYQEDNITRLCVVVLEKRPFVFDDFIGSEVGVRFLRGTPLISGNK